MKNYNNSKKYRSFLVRGIKALAITSLLLALVSCSHGDKIDTDKSSSKSEVTTTCTISTTTSTSTTLTTSSTTTSTDTTMTDMMTTIATTQTIAYQNIQVTEPVYVEPQTEYIAPVEQDYSNGITDYERILLNNIVASEYGSNWVSVPEKAKVVAVVMNRVNSGGYPNSIEGVLTQPYQFSGYYACDYEWSNVTQSCREAVDYYFNHQDEFGNWTGFWGDGTYNHFY